MTVFKGQEYLTKQEFADKIDVSYNTITSMVDRGVLEPALKVQRREFFTEEQVQNYWNGDYVPVRKKN